MHTQTQEAEILGNSFGSSRYLDFLQGLGQLVWLSDCPPDLVYLGGLDRSGTDGQCAYFYQDEIMQGGCELGLYSPYWYHLPSTGIVTIWNGAVLIAPLLMDRILLIVHSDLPCCHPDAHPP